MAQYETHLAVTNRNKEPFSDMWNGVPYTFEPGKVTFAPLAAVKHIFGYGSPEAREAALRRLDRLQAVRVNAQTGKSELVDTREEALKWLSNFSISAAQLVAQPEEPPELPEDEFYSQAGPEPPEREEGEEGQEGPKSSPKRRR